MQFLREVYNINKSFQKMRKKYKKLIDSDKKLKSFIILQTVFKKIQRRGLKSMRKQNRKRKFKWLILPFAALVCFGLTLLLSGHHKLAERFYSNGLYPLIAKILSPGSSLFPFSLDDLFYILLILAVPVLIILLLFRKITPGKAGKIILNSLAGIYILFYFLWGFNYYRDGLNTRLNLQKRQITNDQFRTVLVKLIEETNQSFCNLDSMSKHQTDSLVEASYKELSDVLSIDYPAGIRKDKSITLSRFFAQSGISGYFGPFFNEVHVNKETHPVEYPVVLAHEKAHQFGVTSEAEANFYAWLVCQNSSSQELRYSAGSFILRYFFNQATRREDYKELVSMIDPRVIHDFDRIRKNWDKFRNEKMEKVATKVNDAYLKTNEVEGGVQDYTGVVQFVLDFELDSTFQKKWNLNIE